MLYSGHSSHGVPFLQTISTDHVHEIKQAAFLILEQTGCMVEHPEALKLLKNAGAVIKGSRVYTPRSLVEYGLGRVPKGFMMYNREKKPVMDLSGRRSFFGTSTASPNQRHAIDKTRTPTTLKDIEWGARVADALENIDFVMPFGSAQDVPGNAADLFEFEAAVRNTIKPIVFCGYSAKGVKFVIDMASEIVGGLETLSRKPFIAAYPEPITPLHYPIDIVDKIAVCAKHHIPQVTSGAQFMGFTSPVTIAGSLALATAESFFSILIAQLFREGAPCCLTAAIYTGNMVNGIAFTTGPEQTLALAAQAQIARSLGLPTWGLAGAADSKTPDAQAGIEAALDAALQALSGVNLIHDVGYLDMGMACSCAMMVIGDEIINWIKRFNKGIQVNAQTLATEVIDAVGPMGNFLTQKHTIDHMRKEVWQPKLFFKDSYDAWVGSGSKTLEERADLKVEEIINTHIPKALPESTLDAIRKIRLDGEKNIMKNANG